MMRTNNCVWTILGVLCWCIVVGTSTVFAGGNEKRRTTESGSSSESDETPAIEPRVKWEQIWFIGDRPKRVKIKLYDMESVNRQILREGRKGLGIAGERGVAFETSDPVIIATFDNALTMPLRVAIPDQPGYGAGGGGAWPVLGCIEVFTEKNSFLIGIHSGGFSLGSEQLRQQNRFFSWMIAQQLDDILLLETGRHIPQNIHKGLSGEGYIDGRKRNYEEIRNDKLLRTGG